MVGLRQGILSIISLLLGADSAFAIDIDPNAVDIAYPNAGMNDVDISKYTVKAGDIIKNEIAKMNMTLLWQILLQMSL